MALKLVTKLRHLNSVDSSDLFQLDAHAINFMMNSLDLHFMVKRFLSNSIDHDLMLIEIKSALLKKSIVKKFITENQLQTLPEYKEDDKLERHIKRNPSILPLNMKFIVKAKSGIMTNLVNRNIILKVCPPSIYVHPTVF